MSKIRELKLLNRKITFYTTFRSLNLKSLSIYLDRNIKLHSWLVGLDLSKNSTWKLRRNRVEFSVRCTDSSGQKLND